LQAGAGFHIIVFVDMEIMSKRMYLSKAWIGLFSLVASTAMLSAGEPVCQKISLVSINPNTSVRTNGYAVSRGTTTLVVSLPKIESVGSLSFVNKGAAGRVVVFASPTKLPADSNRWEHVATQSLTDGVVKALVRPNDARYIKITFEASQSGEISRLGVFAISTIASRKANVYALMATDSAGEGVESDGKSVVDGKDLAESKDIPSEGAEAPAEGPPPGLPDPPPFTFVPVLVPTSP
jgi:hypothetical protein